MLKVNIVSLCEPQPEAHEILYESFTAEVEKLISKLFTCTFYSIVFLQVVTTNTRGFQKFTSQLLLKITLGYFVSFEQRYSLELQSWNNIMILWIKSFKILLQSWLLHFLLISFSTELFLFIFIVNTTTADNNLFFFSWTQHFLISFICNHFDVKEQYVQVHAIDTRTMQRATLTGSGEMEADDAPSTEGPFHPKGRKSRIGLSTAPISRMDTLGSFFWY